MHACMHINRSVTHPRAYPRIELNRNVFSPYTSSNRTTLWRLYIHTCIHTCMHTHIKIVVLLIPEHILASNLTAMSFRHTPPRIALYCDGSTYIHTYMHACIHRNCSLTYPGTPPHIELNRNVFSPYIHTCIHTYMHTRIYRICSLTYPGTPPRIALYCDGSTYIHTRIHAYMHISKS